MKHPMIIKRLLEAGVGVQLALVDALYNPQSKVVVYRIGGFYKSGHVDLYPHRFGEGPATVSGFIARARYDETRQIEKLEDLVLFNLYWWECALDRDPNAPPAPGWRQLFQDFGYVKEEKTVHVRYVRASNV